MVPCPVLPPPPPMVWVQNLHVGYIVMEPAKTHGIYNVLTSSASETVVFAAFCNITFVYYYSYSTSTTTTTTTTPTTTTTTTTKPLRTMKPFGNTRTAAQDIITYQTRPITTENTTNQSENTRKEHSQGGGETLETKESQQHQKQAEPHTTAPHAQGGGRH